MSNLKVSKPVQSYIYPGAQIHRCFNSFSPSKPSPKLLGCLIGVVLLLIGQMSIADPITPNHLNGGEVNITSLNDAAIVKELQQATWRDGPGPAGYHSESRWLHYKIPPGNSMQALTIDNPWVFHLDIYTVANGQLQSKYEVGTLRPFNQRPLSNNAFAFPVEANISDVFVHDTSNSARHYPSLLESPIEYSERNANLTMFLGLYYGFAIIMVLYNLAIFVGINNKTYLVFSGYVGSMALFLSSGDGTGARFLWPTAPYIQEIAIGLTWTTTVVLMVEFALHFLRMKHRRKIAHTARWVQIVAAFVGLLVVVSPTPAIYGLQTGYSVLIFAFTLALALQRTLRGDRSGTIFLAATLPLALGTGIHILLLFGVINSGYLLHYSIHISAVFELALFSMALVYRLRQNEQARWQAHRRSVELNRINKELSTAKSMAEEHRQLQKSIQQAQKLKTIGQLAGGFAHDFNNILASIIGFAELAKEKSAQADRAKLMRYLNEIEKSGERGANLVKQLLVYSRSASSRPREINIQDTVGEAQSLLRSSLPATINITTHLPTNKVKLHTDPEQLQQVLVNLCINAAEAMNSRGKIDITVEVLKLNPIVCTSCLQNLSGEYISIKVEDTGPGIKGNAAELFTPFETSKLVGQGSGLGLSVVHGIVHEHKGHIRVSNRSNGGARFTVFLPTQNIQLPVPVGRNILLIEDDPSVAAYLTTFLEDHNFATTVADMPNEALQTFMANPDYYDLVITDHLMPNTTGIELAEDLHALRPDIPIILTTGNANNISQSELNSAGVTSVFEKPLNSDQLLAKIHGLLVTS